MSKKNKYKTYKEALIAARNRVKRKSNHALQEIPPEDYIVADTQQFLDDINLLCSLKFEELREVCLTDDFEKYDTKTKKSTMAYNKVTQLMFLYLRILYMNKEYTGDIIERTFECDNYHKKSENIEYMTLIYGREYALAKLKIKSDRVAGDKNPAYQHGGKYSAFSKNFIKYEELSDEEIAERQKEVAVASSKTKQANPQNENTSIEYYTSRGMTEEEAIDARSERQSTFSLDKCIDQYGLEAGYAVWQERQERWQDSLNNRPYDEVFRSRRKQQRTLWNRLAVNHEYSHVYLFYNEDRNIYKFGITSNLNNRLSFMRSEFGVEFEMIASARFPSDVVIDIEDKLCDIFKMRNLYIHNKDKGEESEKAGLMSLEYVPVAKETPNVYKEWIEVVSNFT